MKKFIVGLLVVIVVAVVGLYATFKYQNRPPDIDVYSMYLNQDPTPKGKTALFVIGLSTTEDFDPTWWHNIYQHIAHVRIPWPFRIAALADRGVALMDPDKDYALEKFEPTSLVDRFGSDRDMDGEPYIEKYRKGQVEWIPPTE